MRESPGAGGTGSRPVPKVDIVPRFFLVSDQPTGRLLARLDWGLIAAVAALATLGLFFILSATLHGGDARGHLARQAAGTVIGFVLMAALALLPYPVLATYAKPIYAASLAALVLTLAVGTRLRGSRSWIDLGPVYVQPVELARLGLLVALAAYAEARPREIRHWTGTLPALLLAAAPFGLVLLQPDLSSALAIAPMTLAVLFVAGAPLGFLAGLAATGAIALGAPLAGTYFELTRENWAGNPVATWLGRASQELGPGLTLTAGVIIALVLAWGFIRRWRVAVPVSALSSSIAVVVLGAAGSGLVHHALKSYQRRRLVAFLDPLADPLGAGYNILQSVIAVGSGRFFGRGYLSGSQSQLGFLPEKHTDFIFSLIAEETGFAGAFFVLVLYFWVAWRAFDIAAGARDRFGRALASGLGTFFAFAGFVNIGMAMGLMPVTGLPLPFLSYGGSGLVGSFAAVGLLLSVHARRYML